MAQASPWGVRQPERRTFGQLAQAANPQQSDPIQARNTLGLPAGKRGLITKPPQPPQWATNRPMPGRVPTGGRFGDIQDRIARSPVGSAPARAHEMVKPSPTGPVAPAQDWREKRLQEAQPSLAEANAAAEARAEESGVGRYVAGGYEAAPTGQMWGGGGYSGVDPRTAEGAGATEPAPTPPPPAPAGGKGGSSAIAQQAQAAGFTPPGGAGAGKGGGASPASPTTPPPVNQQAEPGSNIVPAGEIGQTGGESVGQFEDTGNYDPVTGFAYSFDPRYELEEGSAGGQIVGHENNPEAKARLQKIADQRKADWVAAGGDPNQFLAFNPTEGQFRQMVPGWDQMTEEQKWQARQEERKKFYARQWAALQRSLKPGVQE